MYLSIQAGPTKLRLALDTRLCCANSRIIGERPDVEMSARRQPQNPLASESIGVQVDAAPVTQEAYGTPKVVNASIEGFNGSLRDESLNVHRYAD